MHLSTASCFCQLVNLIENFNMWQILEWKNRAQVSEQRVEELQMKISELQSKLHTFKAHFPTPAAIPSQDQWSEACKMENPRTKPPHQQSQECGKEEKKHVLICRVKHSPSSVIPKRSPFQEIGNITLPRQQRWEPRRIGGLLSAETTWVSDGLLQWVKLWRIQAWAEEKTLSVWPPQ